MLQRAKRVYMWLMDGKQLLGYADHPLKGKRETGQWLGREEKGTEVKEELLL